MTTEPQLSCEEARQELIDHMVGLCGKVKFHHVDADAIEYLDEDRIVLLRVSQVRPPDINGDVTWGYLFTETKEYYEFTENIYITGAAERPEGMFPVEIED